MLLGGASLPGIGGHDRRVPVAADALPWAALVRLQIPGVSRCTGFLIDPQTVVTAAHCLYGRRLGHFAPAAAVHLLLGYDKGAFVRHEVAASYTVAAGYVPDAGTLDARDVAVVQVSQPMAPAASALQLLDGALPPGTPLSLGGYGQDRVEAVLADTGCTLQGYASAGAAAVMVHDCEGTSGTSGAPVLARDAAGVWRAAGVQVTARTSGAGGTAVPASVIRDVLDQAYPRAGRSPDDARRPTP